MLVSQLGEGDREAGRVKREDSFAHFMSSVTECFMSLLSFILTVSLETR